MVYDPTKPFKEQVMANIRKTWKDKVVEVGPYAMVKLRDGRLGLFHADGIGTKGYLHWQQKTFKEAAQDALAMNVDDSIMLGVYPEVVVDHMILAEESNEAILGVTEGLCDLCSDLDIVVPGGETAILDTIKGLEVGVVTYGSIDEKDIVKPKIKDGDKIIGIESSGIHSNGLTFIREMIFDKLKLKMDSTLPCYLNKKIGEELTIPTHIYLPVLKEVLDNYRDKISGMMHITGGAFSKLLDIAGNNALEITKEHGLTPQPIFNFLRDQNLISEVDMYRKFNCGIGFVITCRPGVENDLVGIIGEKFKAEVIGQASKSPDPAVLVYPHFSANKVFYKYDNNHKVFGTTFVNNV